MIIFLRVRRYPIGMELVDAGADARVWAPGRKRVVVVHGANAERTTTLTAQADGYFGGIVPGLRAGDRYGFRLDDDAKVYADPASRSQPGGPHGPSAIVDPTRFAWTDADWRGVGRDGQVIYEMHVGTFTMRARARRRRSSCRRSPTRHHGRRDDAGRRVRRARSAGATTASTCSRRRASTARPTTCARSSIARTRSGSASSSTSSTTTSGRTASYLEGVCAGLLQRRRRQRMGRGAQLRRPRVGPGARVLRRQRRLLDRRVPLRRPAARRDAADPRRVARTRAGGDRPPRPRRGARPRDR